MGTSYGFWYNPSMPVSDLVKSLLTKRGFTSEPDIQAFLSPDYTAHTHSPFLLADMDIAVLRVFEAMDAGERIAIYSDFDCDGIPGAAVLSDLFTKLGYTNFEVYIPHRDREGYGYHTPAIDTLKSRDVKLVITVDLGTKANESIDYANSLGIDTIVTDHHEIDGPLPDAVAVLNPKRAPYPFSGLCGAAMAWKLAQAIILEGEKKDHPRVALISPGWEKWLLDLVVIATIADLVPLTGENRVLAYWGMQVLRKSRRPGIVALCDKLRLRRMDLDETDIGFSFAPRINAASRMDSPELGLRLLTTTDAKEAQALAEQLESLNASRKGVVAGIVKEAKKRVRERFKEGDRVTVLGNPDWKPALLGLAANSIMGERGGVVVMWGRDANGKLKGSARSDGAISVVELFSKAGEVLEEYGGHHASGGFTVSKAGIHTLPEVLAAVAAQIEAKPVVIVSEADAVIALREVTTTLLRDVSRLAPYGMGNAKPVFRISRLRVISVRRFGKEKNHTEVSLICPDSGVTRRAFQFFKAPEDFSVIPAPEMQVDVFATIERDSFKGPGQLALRIVDIVNS